jgi:hypothetical protein
MATTVLHGIKFFEQLNNLKVTTKGTFLWSLNEIGLVVYEEMSFKVKVYGRTTDGRPDEKRSQKLTLSLCDRWAKKQLSNTKGMSIHAAIWLENYSWK